MHQKQSIDDAYYYVENTKPEENEVSYDYQPVETSELTLPIITTQRTPTHYVAKNLYKLKTNSKIADSTLSKYNEMSPRNSSLKRQKSKTTHKTTVVSKLGVSSEIFDITSSKLYDKASVAGINRNSILF